MKNGSYRNIYCSSEIITTKYQANHCAKSPVPLCFAELQIKSLSNGNHKIILYYVNVLYVLGLLCVSISNDNHYLQIKEKWAIV